MTLKHCNPFALLTSPYQSNVHIITYLQTIHTTPVGGAFLSMIELADAEVAAGHTLTVLVSVVTSEQKREVQQFANHTNIQISFVRHYQLVLILLFHRFFRSRQTLLRIHSGRPVISSKVQMLRRIWGANPLFWYIHGSFFMENFNDPSIQTNHVNNAAYLDAILLPSQSDRQEHINLGISPDQLFYIPDVVEIKTTTTNHVPPSHDCPVILFCSRVEPSKGLSELIQAFSMLEGQAAHCQLIVAGDGNQLEEIKQKSHHLGNRITFLGNVADVQTLYHSASIFICPSQFECFGRTAYEAALCETPMILSRIKPWVDIFVDEEHCLYIDPTSPTDIKRQLNKCLTNNHLANSMAHRAKEHAEQICSPERVVKKIQQIYTAKELSM